MSNSNLEPTVTIRDFLKVDIRAGTVIEAKPFKRALKPAYVLMIDFGEMVGIKKSSAQITDLYTVEELVGKRVVAVVNLYPKQIANIKSEVLVLGFPDSNQSISLIGFEHDIPNGARLI